ncbi:unnamed protein product [Anisakis simplex]|uniref:Uncharacterized protein n=1 Tax=Anisakis simplex TaxID=6269 RepID=A0A0M3JK64_ANISI|nr:unnamed protein product [Anisakis simplex]
MTAEENHPMLKAGESSHEPQSSSSPEKKVLLIPKDLYYGTGNADHGVDAGNANREGDVENADQRDAAEKKIREVG